MSNKPKATAVSAEAFVKAWQKATTVSDVSKATGLTPASASARAAQYRKRGVNLKKFPRQGGARLDIDALNALVS